MRVVFITSRFPYPLEKGDKLRAFQHIKAMSDVHEVHLLALSDVEIDESDFKKVSELCASVKVYKLSKLQVVFNLLNAMIAGLPLQVGYFYSERIKKRMAKTIRDIQPDLVYCQLIRTALYSVGVDSHKMIDFQDAFVTGTAQRLDRAGFLLRPLFSRELNKVKAFEEKCFSWFEKHLVISERDRNGISHPDSSQVVVIPNGVDTSYYKPVQNTGQSKMILFVGNMNYTPNVDAALFLANEIMPKVWTMDPSVRLTLAGANPSAAVVQLAGERVTVTGWVDDMRDEYIKADLFVAPMRIGTGVQNKILEAMAMGLPCITTELSAEPLGAENGRDILVSETAESISVMVIELLNNRDKAKEYAQNGLRFIQGRYSVEKMNKLLNQCIEDVVDP
jgi:sugar transferase (PEP-CTERM/EpsH1 system associated)